MPIADAAPPIRPTKWNLFWNHEKWSAAAHRNCSTWFEFNTQKPHVSSTQWPNGGTNVDSYILMDWPKPNITNYQTFKVNFSPHEKKSTQKTNALARQSLTLTPRSLNQSDAMCAYMRSAWLPTIRQGIRCCHFIHLFTFLVFSKSILWLLFRIRRSRPGNGCVCVCACVCGAFECVNHSAIQPSINNTSTCDFLHKRYSFTIAQRKRHSVGREPSSALHCKFHLVRASFDTYLSAVVASLIHLLHDTLQRGPRSVGRFSFFSYLKKNW